MYKKLLVSVDFSSETDTVIQKACSLGNCTNAEIHLVHVLEDPMPIYDTFTLPTVPVTDMEEVRAPLLEKLHVIAEKYAIVRQHCHIQYGSVSKTIIDFSDEIGADLIVAGSHGRHGLGLILLGSTSGSVLHHSHVDFLAVRVQ